MIERRVVRGARIECDRAVFVVASRNLAAHVRAVRHEPYRDRRPFVANGQLDRRRATLFTQAFGGMLLA